MADEHDYDVLKDSHPTLDEPPPERPRPVGVWIAVGLLGLAAAIAAYFALNGASAPPQEAVVAPPPVAAPPVVQPVAPPIAMVEIPPLADSDPVVRELVRQLSSHPQVAAWLATDGLIRNFAVAVLNVAEGTSPAGRLAALKPSAGFSVAEQGEYTFISPRAYARYNTIADAVGAIDPQGAARLYANLRPRLQEAHAELGFPDTPFDRTLERAIVELLSTPVPAEALRVVPRGIGYGYADERLEDLSGAQKQLLRFGPRNARMIQDALRRLAEAVGIPADRLPRPRT